MRIWVRTKIEKSRLQSSDYLVLLGWIFSFVWALCCILDLGLGIRDWATVLASVPLLKVRTNCADVAIQLKLKSA